MYRVSFRHSTSANGIQAAENATKQHARMLVAGDADDACLVLGTSGGWLQIHSPDGTLLHRQQLHMLPVLAVRIRYLFSICSRCSVFVLFSMACQWLGNATFQ